MKLLLAILAFNAIVIIHELGHFLVAKYFKIKVYEFSLFVGPKIYSFQHKETVFSIRMIPMLAYVAFDKEDSVYEDRSLNKYPIIARAATVAAGPIFNIASAAVALMVMFSIAGYQTTKISTVKKDTPAYYAGIKEGDKIVSFDGKRVYQPMEIDMFLYNISKGNTVKIEVLRNGKMVPLQFTPMKRFLLGFRSRLVNGQPTNIIDTLEPGGPAERAGLKPGDAIMGLDDREINSMQQILNFMRENKGEPVKVTVMRDGSVLPPFTITPMHAYFTELYYTYEKGNIFEIVKEAVIRTYSLARIGVYSFLWLAQGKVPLNQMTGAVGAVDAINTAVQQGTTFKEVIMLLLFFSALISVGLAVTNLLPIPPADGSKLLLLAVEAVRRKPIPQDKEAFIMMVGFMFMILLFVFTLYNDIVRIIMRAFGG